MLQFRYCHVSNEVDFNLYIFKFLICKEEPHDDVKPHYLVL